MIRFYSIVVLVLLVCGVESPAGSPQQDFYDNYERYEGSNGYGQFIVLGVLLLVGILWASMELSERWQRWMRRRKPPRARETSD